MRPIRLNNLTGDAGGAILNGQTVKAANCRALVPFLVELAEQCRFRDCAHRGEPGCAVQAAIDTGDLPAMRVRLFLELVDELDSLRKREAQRARREKGGGRRRR